jgi:tripartite-type tricarboxylate transporter receptor subunit TctC
VGVGDGSKRLPVIAIGARSGSRAKLVKALVPRIALASSMLATALDPAWGQPAYPTQPVRFVIAFGAGGAADATARLVAEKLSAKLGQRVVVENNPGAGGMNAARVVLSAPTDGHTLMLLTNGTSISVSLFKNLSFNPLADFAPVTKIGKLEFFLATNAMSPYGSLADVIREARSHPGKLNVGTINPGSTQHLSALLLKSTAGIEFQYVPFRNSPDLLVALLRGDVDVAIDAYASFRGNFEDGRLRLLATSAPTRSPLLPDIPTAKEVGAGDFEATAWNGLFVKNGTPAAIIAQLNKAVAEVLADGDLKKHLLEMGIFADPTSPEELTAFFKSDIAKWAQLIAKNNIEQR